MTSQPTPRVTDADVERIVRREFDAARVEEVLTLLDEYGTESWHGEHARVRLALLKLSAGSEDRLRTNVQAASTDYRDVLCSAEYPSYIEQVPANGSMGTDEEQRIIDADWEQYRKGLAADGADSA